MALSGLEIYKLLPKTNCRKCGYSTCLAFAMALAKKQVALDKCEFVSDDVKAVLQEASLAPMRLVKLGIGDNAFEVGGETVLFRHEEKFHHPAGIGCIIDDSLPPVELKKKVVAVNSFCFERVGQAISVNLIGIRQCAGADTFIAAVKSVAASTQLPLALISKDAKALKGALEVCAKQKPVLYGADENNADELIALAKSYNVALVVSASGLEAIEALAQKASSAGVSDVIIEPRPVPGTNTVEQYTFIRRLVLKKKKRTLGYPILSVIDNKDPFVEAIEAGAAIAKYASLVLVKTAEPWHILSLLTLRQNIYTDPQKPLQVEPKAYSVGQVDEKSPVMVTTNFSLSYYTVLGEVEASKVPSYIVSVDTEGMSVLTAWAAEKFTPEKIAESLEKFDVKNKVAHGQVIIPGYVSVMSGDLEEKSGWKVIVGPKEASGLPSFLKKLS